LKDKAEELVCVEYVAHVENKVFFTTTTGRLLDMGTVKRLTGIAIGFILNKSENICLS